VAINRISGNILQDDLVRGSDLAFQGNLVYINVSDTRVGINTAATTHTLTVQGDTNISDTLFANSVAVTANVSADGITANTISVGNVDIGNLLSGGNLVVNSLTSNTFVTAVGNITAGNLRLNEQTLLTTVAGNITIEPTGNNLLIINTTAGMQLPLGNTAERPAPAVQGTVRFNSETLRVEFYDGVSWQEITTAVTNQTLNGDGSTVNFALDRGTVTAAILVSLNGVLQLPVTAYAVTGPAGNVLTFTEAPLSTDVIDVRFL
jgi:hypothetical protein